MAEPVDAYALGVLYIEPGIKLGDEPIAYSSRRLNRRAEPLYHISGQARLDSRRRFGSRGGAAGFAATILGTVGQCGLLLERRVVDALVRQLQTG